MKNNGYYTVDCTNGIWSGKEFTSRRKKAEEYIARSGRTHDEWGGFRPDADLSVIEVDDRWALRAEAALAAEREFRKQKEMV